jgi:hypothetical protein
LKPFVAGVPSETAPAVYVDPERMEKAIMDLIASVRGGADIDAVALTEAGLPQMLVDRIVRAGQTIS